MNIDDIAYELYKKVIINKDNLNSKKFGYYISSYVYFNYFKFHKNEYTKYYEEALIIERQNKIKTLL